MFHVQRSNVQPRVHPHVQYLMWMDACCVPGPYHASHRMMMIPGRGSIPLRFLMESLSCTMRSWILISNVQSQAILQRNCAVLSALSPNRSLAWWVRGGSSGRMRRKFHPFSKQKKINIVSRLIVMSQFFFFQFIHLMLSCWPFQATLELQKVALTCRRGREPLCRAKWGPDVSKAKAHMTSIMHISNLMSWCRSLRLYSLSLALIVSSLITDVVLGRLWILYKSHTIHEANYNSIH
jgi:hypothetical protein